MEPDDKIIYVKTCPSFTDRILFSFFGLHRQHNPTLQPESGLLNNKLLSLIDHVNKLLSVIHKDNTSIKIADPISTDTNIDTTKPLKFFEEDKSQKVETNL
jgi:hypothetical protein